MITELTVWETSDGKQWGTKKAAEAHESVCVLAEELRGAEDLYWRDISAEDVAAYMIRHYNLERKANGNT